MGPFHKKRHWTLVFLACHVIFNHVNIVSASDDDCISNRTIVQNSTVLENGDLAFSPLKTYADFELKEFLDENDSGSWNLAAYCALAREFILGLVKIDWDVIRTLVIDKELPPIPDLVKMELPITIAFGIGLLFAIFTPIVGIFFCCCRCCGNCGAKLTRREAESQTPIKGFFILLILLSSCLFLLVGAGAIYKVGQRLPKTGTYIADVADTAIDDALKFVEQILGEVEQTVGEDLDFVTEVISDNLDTLPDQVAGPFMTDARPRVTVILNAVLDLETDILSLTTNLGNAEATMATIPTYNTILQTALDNIKDNLTSIKNECYTTFGGPPHTNCDDLPDQSVVPTAHDFSDVPSLEDQTSMLDDANTLNLNDIVITANTTFEDIPSMIDNETLSTRNDIKNVLNDIGDTIDDLIGPFKDTIKNSTSSLDDIKSTIRDNTEGFIEPYAPLISYAFMGLASVVFVVLAPVSLGILCGFMTCGDKPEKRGRAGAWGNCCLVFAAVICFLFVFVFLLPGAILFLLGTNFTVICTPLRDLTIFHEIIDKPAMWDGEYLLSKNILQNGSIEMTIEGVLNGCKANKAAYSVLKLKHLFDIADVVNIEEQIPDMSGMNTTVNDVVGNVELLDASTRADLDGIVSSNATSMNPIDMMADLNDGITDLDLSDLITKLNTAADSMDAIPGAEDMADDYRKMIAVAVHAQNVIKPQISDLLDTLATQLTQVLDGVNDLQSSVGLLVGLIVDFQDYLAGGPGLQIVLNSITGYIDKIIGIAAQFVNHIVYRLQCDLGSCETVWNVYDALTGSFCSFFLDAFNALWMSLCIIGVFMVSLIISAVKLGRYFKRPVDNQEYLHGYDSRERLTSREMKYLKDKLTEKY